MVMERWRPGWGISPWRPLRELNELQKHLEDMLGRPALARAWKPLLMEMKWMPAIDIFEKKDKLVVKAEIPGMREEDINVSVVGDTLTIKGERKVESEVKEEDYYCCERSYGYFSRSITLPSHVDAKKIEASYEDGVLEITLPKTTKAKPRKVSVSAKKRGKASK